MSKEMLYLSGKITENTPEKVEQNNDQFSDKATDLVDKYVVFNPADNFGKTGKKMGWTWKEYLKHDLEALKHCSTVFMMSNWQESRGAKIEHWLAKKWGKKIVYENE